MDWYAEGPGWAGWLLIVATMVSLWTLVVAAVVTLFRGEGRR